MESWGSRALAVAMLFITGTFATPLHLVIDAHDWGHEERPTTTDLDHSHHEPHPSSDHQLDQVSSASARPVTVVVETPAVNLPLVTPDVQAWAPTVEAEANSPPSSPGSPPRSPRAPPL